MVVALAAVALAAVALAAVAADPTPLFMNGRPRGGLVKPPARLSGKQLPPDLWYTGQTLNHFNPQDTRTWSQRYWRNADFYKPGGPVFLMIEGESTGSPIWLVEDTSIVNYAKAFGAMILQVEHRFYGASQPTGDLSTESLQYLSSEQALADLAQFHEYAQETYALPENTQWVSFGGSYSGALSSWFRLKYPHLVVGAVATSGPVQPELDFTQYLEVVQASLTSMGSPTCVGNIAGAVAKLTTLLQSAQGRAKLSAMFQTCTPLDMTASTPDVQNFVSSLAGNFEGVVQYNNDNRAFEGAVDTNVTIPVLCQLMDDETVADPLQRYANVNSLILKTYSEPCLSFNYDQMIQSLQNDSLSPSTEAGGRQWTYQTCAEFGWYQTSDSPAQPFGSGFPLSFSVQQCTDIFGAAFNMQSLKNAIAWTMSNYGGSAPAVTNVVFPNGSVDPWHAMGVTSDLSPTAPAIYIQGTAHCADMYPPTPNDPASLVAARQLIQQQIAQWLQQTAAV